MYRILISVTWQLLQLGSFERLSSDTSSLEASFWKNLDDVLRGQLLKKQENSFYFWDLGLWAMRAKCRVLWYSIPFRWNQLWDQLYHWILSQETTVGALSRTSIFICHVAMGDIGIFNLYQPFCHVTMSSWEISFQN